MLVIRVSSAIVGLCLLLLAITTVSGQQSSKQISKATEVLTDVLLKATSEDRFNYVTSPFAGSVILTLAAEGAESETKNQLITAMGGEYPDKNSYKDVLTSIKGFSSDGNAQNRVVLKNFLYVYKNYSVLESFAELAREYYLTDVKSVARPDLEVRRNFEDDKSPAEAPADESATSAFKEHAMLIFNGFSLEMSWPTSTWHRTSVSWNGNVVRAFGAAGNFAVGQISSLDCTAFKLPYKNTDYALLVLLPKTKDNLDDVLNKLSENSISELTKSMSMKPAFVTMPCFQSSNITNLKTVLQQETNANAVFTDSADLSNLSSDNLFLDDVVQQTDVNVCIEGTSSHSLSSSAFTSQRVIKESVVADRPFVYVLYNVVNDIVFVAGKLEQPFWEEPVDEGLDSDIEAIKMS